MPASMASLLLLALVFSLATGQFWRSNMDLEEMTGHTGQNWPGTPLGEDTTGQKHDAEVGEPKSLNVTVDQDTFPSFCLSKWLVQVGLRVFHIDLFYWDGDLEISYIN